MTLDKLTNEKLIGKQIFIEKKIIKKNIKNLNFIYQIALKCFLF